MIPLIFQPSIDFFFDKLEELTVTFQNVLFLHIPVTFFDYDLCTGIAYLACRSGKHS